LRDTFHRGFELVGRFRCPPDQPHELRLKSLTTSDAVNHFPVLYKIAPVGLFNPASHASDEEGLILKHATDGP